jgi:hypothetical protein
MKKVKLSLHIITATLVLFSCTASERTQISKDFVSSKEPGKKVFMVTLAGDTIAGNKWKLQEHTGSKKIQEMSIDGTTMPINELKSFQSPYGLARRYSFESQKKQSINSSFVYYVRRGSKLNLLHTQQLVSSFYNTRTGSSEQKYISVYFIEKIEKSKYSLSQIDFDLLKSLSEENQYTKIVFEKHKKIFKRDLDYKSSGGFESVDYDDLLEFIDAYNK